MRHQHYHILEKTQVQFAGGLCLAIIYFIIAPMLVRWDPLAPTVFIASGELTQFALVAGIFCVLSAICAGVTANTRPEGAFLAALAGCGGLSLYSESIRSLLWQYEGSMTSMFWMLIAEVFVFGIIMVAGEIVVFVVRRAIARWRPSWIWKGRITLAGKGKQDPETAGPGAGFVPLVASIRLLVASKKGDVARADLRRGAGCLVVSILLAMVMLMFLMQAASRGQIVGAMFISFFLAVLISHQQIPAQQAAVAWMAPLITAILFYVLAGLAAVESAPDAWARVQPYAQALPIDWFSIGGAGALLGFWVSERIHEIRHIDAGVNKEV